MVRGIRFVAESTKVRIHWPVYVSFLYRNCYYLNWI